MRVRCLCCCCCCCCRRRTIDHICTSSFGRWDVVEIIRYTIFVIVFVFHSASLCSLARADDKRVDEMVINLLLAYRNNRSIDRVSFCTCHVAAVAEWLKITWSRTKSTTNQYVETWNRLSIDMILIDSQWRDDNCAAHRLFSVRFEVSVTRSTWFKFMSLINRLHTLDDLSIAPRGKKSLDLLQKWQQKHSNVSCIDSLS